MVAINPPARYEIVSVPSEDEVAAIVAVLACQREMAGMGTDGAPRLGRWESGARPLLRGATGVDRWHQERSWGGAARRV